MGLPFRWTSQQTWGWTGLGWERQAVVSSAELADWITAALGREDIKTIGGDWPARQKRRVYAGIGAGGRVVAWVVPTWCIVLVVSGLTLMAGLALCSTSAWRRPGVMIGLLAALGLAAAAFPAARAAGGPGCPAWRRVGRCGRGPRASLGNPSRPGTGGGGRVRQFHDPPGGPHGVADRGTSEHARLDGDRRKGRVMKRVAAWCLPVLAPCVAVVALGVTPATAVDPRPMIAPTPGAAADPRLRAGRPNGHVW